MYSKRGIEHELSHKIVSFYTFYQLLVTGLWGVAVIGDIFYMYVFLTVFSLSAYASMASRGKIALKASFTYLVMGLIGACFFLLGIIFLYLVTGSLNMHDLSLLLPPLYGNRVVQAAFAFFIVGLGIKMALFPLHTWLLDAHAFWPPKINAILTSIVILVLTYVFMNHQVSSIDTIISGVAAIAIITGGLYWH
jgi:multicomponent Na+:H+ antiporter subunit D